MGFFASKRSVVVIRYLGINVDSYICAVFYETAGTILIDFQIIFLFVGRRLCICSVRLRLDICFIRLRLNICSICQ